MPDLSPETIRAMRETLAKLVEWDTWMGSFDAPVWKTARRLMDHIRNEEADGLPLAARRRLKP